ncbi:permease [Aeromonas jandaei]
MLVDILRLVFIAGGLVFIFMLVQACWQKRCNGTFESTPFWPVALIGGVANFLDTLGVGSFAVKTACYKQFKLIDDRLLPGTLNGQCVLPTVTQSLIFVGAVAVEPLTLISMMIAAAAGAAWGARHVASFDRQTIRLVMAVSLLVVAGLIFAGLLGLFPVGGEAMGLSGYKLVIALIGNFIFGVLMNVGIGLFAPCMTLVYLLGMNPLAAFPIMMGSTAVLSVFSAGTFIRKGAFDAKAVLAVAIFGPIGVVLAAMLVKSMDMAMLKWLVAFIVIYTS